MSAVLITSSVAFFMATGLPCVSDAAQQNSKSASPPSPPVTQQAQTQPVAAAPVSSEPETTTANFADWVLRCQATAQQKRVCEIATVITPQGQNTPVAQLIVAKQLGKDGKKLAVLLPSNIVFATKPKLVLAKSASFESDFTWINCGPGSCLAISNVSEDGLAVLASQTEPAKIVFHDSTDREINIIISFRGFSQANAAYAKEQ